MSVVSVAGEILLVFMALSNAIRAAGGICRAQFSEAKNRAGMRQAFSFKFYLIGGVIALYLLICCVSPPADPQPDDRQCRGGGDP